MEFLKEKCKECNGRGFKYNDHVLMNLRAELELYGQAIGDLFRDGEHVSSQIQSLYEGALENYRKYLNKNGYKMPMPVKKVKKRMSYNTYIYRVKGLSGALENESRSTI